MKVYLAGGMHGNWRGDVINRARAAGDSIGFLEFIDPCDNGGGRPSEFSTWDIEAVKQCDIVFAYFEKENPGGESMVFEIAYGLALGKTVILVDEQMKRYWGLVRERVDVLFEDFGKAIEYLEKYSYM